MMNHFSKNYNWNIPLDWPQIRVIDMHTGGEPLRIPISGLPDIPGSSVLEKRDYFRKNLDHIRTRLIWEPRGHADMYGAIISPPSTPVADFDVFFIHNAGYSTMCGHAIIALTKFAIETRFVELKDKNELVINVPAGTIRARAEITDGIVIKSSFVNVPSYLVMEGASIAVAGLEQVMFDLAYGGAFYAIVDAEDLGLSLQPASHAQLIDYGRRIKYAIMERYEVHHPTEQDLSFLYGTIFTGTPYNEAHHSRNVCIFADGELDRSPTGSGVSARAGLQYAKGALSLHQPIIIESILGSTMTVEAIEEVDYFGHKAIIPRVMGSASFVGEATFYFDPSDPYKDGFILR